MTRRRPGAHALAAEIVRRVTAASAETGGGYVVRLSDPPTPTERLQLLVARLEHRPIVIMPHKCKTVEEWAARYSGLAKR